MAVVKATREFTNKDMEEMIRNMYTTTGLTVKPVERKQSDEDIMVDELVMVSRILDKYSNIKMLDAAMYLVDGYLEELENVDEEDE